MILEGVLQAGERLPAERKLAEQFGVSRPSLREAIQKLVAKGLLVSRQGGGNYVNQEVGTTFSDPLLALLAEKHDAQKDLLEFRHTLEGACAYLRRAACHARRPRTLRRSFCTAEACYEGSAENCRTGGRLSRCAFSFGHRRGQS